MQLVQPILALSAAVLVGILGARELAAGWRSGLARRRAGHFPRFRQAAMYWCLLSVQAALFLGASTGIYVLLLSR